MHDESIDEELKELETALEVRPSADMVARIRLEASRQMTNLPQLRFRLIAPIGAALAIATVSFLWLTRQPTMTVDEARDKGSAIPVPLVEQLEKRAVSNTRRPLTRARAHFSNSAGQVVLTEQAKALTRLLAGIRTGRVSVRPEILMSFHAAEPLPEIAPIQIPLIRIEPLTEPPDESGQRRPL